MQYQRFGSSGMQVSRLCLGAMTFGNKLDDADSARVIDEALDHGVNLIDTADSYDRSEEVLGQALSTEKREKIFLATKVFRRFCRERRLGRNSRTNIINSLERSLRLLQTDYVDLYQLHHPDDTTPIEETISTLDDLVRQGKIRYYGVSNHYAWQMATMIGQSKANHWEPLISLQASYDILDRQIERETVPFLERFDVALMCYGPLCGGLLTDKYLDEDGGIEIPEGSRGAQNRSLQAYLEKPQVREAMETLEALVGASDYEMNQLAILWLLAKPHVSTVILGGSKPEHFRQLYAIADDELAAEIVTQIDEISAPQVFTEFKNQPVREGPALAVER